MMAAQKIDRVLVSKRALVQRINRSLAHDMEMLRAARGPKMQQEVGDFYVIDLRRNAILHKDVDLEEMGRELKVLAQWERLEGQQ